MSLAMLAMMMSTTNALMWMPPSTYGLWHTLDLAHRRSLDLAQSYYDTAETSPYWTATADEYNLKMRLPELEPQSVSAALASDGKKIEVVGQRKISGCSCTPSIVEQISLPYRPRAEDIAVSVKNDVLSLTLARHAAADEATPLKVVVHEDAAKPKERDESQAANTRPLRFVPHESATTEVQPPSVDTQEKTLANKFRSVALASLAATTPSTTHQDAPTTVDVPMDAPNASAAPAAMPAAAVPAAAMDTNATPAA